MSGERENDSLLEVQKESGDNIPTKKQHNSEYQKISYGATIKGVLVSLLLLAIYCHVPPRWGLQQTTLARDPLVR